MILQSQEWIICILKKKKKITHDIRIVYFAQKYDLMLYIFVNYIHIKLIYMQKFAYVKLYNIYI